MPSRSTLLQILKASVSVGLLLFVASRIDWAQLLDLLRNAKPGWLAAAALLMALERVVAVMKWNVLLIAKGVHVAFRPLLRITLIGNFWGLFLPSSLSIDVVRGYQLYRYTASGTLSASSVVVDRLLGLVSLLVFCIAGIVLQPAWTADPRIRAVVIVLAAATAIGVYILQHERIPDLLERRAPVLTRNRVGQKVFAAHRAVLDYKRSPYALLRCFAGSLLLQSVRVLTVYVLALTFSVHAPIGIFFVLVPVAMILVMITPAIGGFGVREVSFVTLLAAVGIPTTDAFAISFTNSILATLVSMLGGLAYIAHRPAPKDTSGADAN